MAAALRIDDVALWTAAFRKTIMCSRSCESLGAPTFRHAHHEFPVTVKAVVFDAYGTLYDSQSAAVVTAHGRKT